MYFAQETTQSLLLGLPGNAEGVVSRVASWLDCVFTDGLQAEFIYEHLEGVQAVAGTGDGNVGTNVDVGVIDGPNEKPCGAARGSGVLSCSRRRSGYSCLRFPCTYTESKGCAKKQNDSLVGVVNHTLWHGQICNSVTHVCWVILIAQ